MPATTGPRAAPASVLLLAAAALWGLGACARMEAPPGGPPDRLPPLVIGTQPDTFAVVEGGRREVRIRFSERISERPGSGTLNGAVRVSPVTGAVRVEHDRESLVISLQGGFRPGLVYRVTVLPVIQDLFDNTMSDPFELVFSTGGEFHQTLLAGRVLDRITGEAAAGARINAVSPEDSLRQVAVADSAGIFALRYLTPRRYRVTAFQDRNRNDSTDFGEPTASRQVILAATDTILIERIQILAADTSPARLASVEIRDSISLRLELDDYVDPEAPLDGVTVTLFADTTSLSGGSGPGADSAGARDSVQTADTARGEEPAAGVPDSLGVGEGDQVPPDTTPAPPDVVGVYHEFELEARLRALADSVARAAGEETAEDEEGPGQESPADERSAGERAPQQPGEAAPEDSIPASERRPQQAIFALLDTPLPPGAVYRVEVSGVRNIAGTPGGGGSATIRVPEPPPPDSAETAADSAAAPDSAAAADSADAAADTSGAAVDTSGAPPDTTETPPDTTATPPDTTEVPPDTTGAPPKASTGDVASASPVPRLGVVSGGSPPWPRGASRLAPLRPGQAPHPKPRHRAFARDRSPG